MHAAGIDSQAWRQHAWVNRLQSLVLLVLMGVFLALLGWLLWGVEGIVLLLVTGLIGIVLNPGVSPRWVMRIYGASQIGPGQAPEILALASELAARAGLPTPPALYYVPSRMLNAFAVGSRNNSAIAITDGLLRQLRIRELAGVLAHEVSHIRSNDLWVMGLADIFSRATSLLSLLGQLLLIVNLPLLLFSAVTINWFAIVLLIFAPTLSAMAQLALARTREYDADLNAVRLTADPDGLASALAKIEAAQGGWLERIFLPGRRIPDPSLLRTHPETRQRIARLTALKSEFTDDGQAGGLRSAADVHSGFGQPVSHPPRWHVSGLWH